MVRIFFETNRPSFAWELQYDNIDFPTCINNLNHFKKKSVNWYIPSVAVRVYFQFPQHARIFSGFVDDLHNLDIL